MRRASERDRRIASRWSAALAALILAAACAAPGGMRGTPESAEETFIRQTVQSMAEALTAGDADRLLAKVSDGYYRGYGNLERRLRALLAARTGIELTAEVVEVVFEGARVTAVVRWSASWTNRPAGSRETVSGKDRLVFMKGLGLKLIDQSGDSLLGF